MKITDGTRTVEIEIKCWNGNGWDPDFSYDFFEAGTLPYDEENDVYTVDSVDYCIDQANDCINHAGDFVDLEDQAEMFVFVKEIGVKEIGD